MTSQSLLPQEPPTASMEEQTLADLYHAQQHIEDVEDYQASFDHVEAYLEDAFEPVRSYWTGQGRDPGTSPDISYSINERGASYEPDPEESGDLTFGLPASHPLDLSLFAVYVHEIGHQYNQRQVEQHTAAPEDAAVTTPGGTLKPGIDEGFMQLWTYSMVEDIGDQDARELFIQDRIQHYRDEPVDEELFAGVAMEISDRMTSNTGDAAQRFRTAYQEVESEVLHAPDRLPAYLDDPFSTDWIERLL
ncbi:MAG: hypothetical protein SVU32_04635 [Candidatus Nanohaloarchaea archaeon]|nr:hypothetical protein [Candidatus Nanohaloarchaea archaeon]